MSPWRALLARAIVVALAVAAAAGGARAEDLVVRGDLVHTLNGAPLENGVVVITDGRIAAVGRDGEVAIPEGARVLAGKVVTPGLIDARGTVGFTGILNQPHDQDQFDRGAPVQPELRAIDGFDAREPLLAYLRSFGITTVHTGHGPGPLVSGQTLIAKTRGDTVAAAVRVEAAMVAANLGEGAAAGKDAPGTRAKRVALLRSRLVAAAEHARRRQLEDPAKRPPRDLALETLGEVLEGRLPLLVHAERHQDVEAALRLAREFGFRLVLEGVADAPLLLDELKTSGCTVILHPTMARPSGERENASFKTAALLHEAGIPFAFGSGHEDYVPKVRVVLLEAAVAAANGLPREAALAAITRDAAAVLGILDRAGTLEPGKDADLAIYDGDPFEYTTHCIATVVDGVVEEVVR